MYLQQKKTLLMGLKVLSLAALFSFSSGCTVTMMTPQDSETKDRIGMITESANELLFELEDVAAEKPECEYEHHTERYRYLKVQLKSFQIYEMAKAKNVQTVKQVEALQERVNQLVDMHKKQCLPAPVVKVTQNQINDMLGHMLKLEKSKRETETSE